MYDVLKMMSREKAKIKSFKNVEKNVERILIYTWNISTINKLQRKILKGDL